jgi:hypothetical protein
MTSAGDEERIAPDTPAGDGYSAALFDPGDRAVRAFPIHQNNASSTPASAIIPTNMSAIVSATGPPLDAVADERSSPTTADVPP